MTRNEKRERMPSDERYRAAVMAPRPYRIVDADSVAPGEMTLTLAPIPSPDAGLPGDGRQEPGQYWILHTPRGAQIPVVPTMTTGAQREVTTLRVPCEPPIGRVGDRVGLRGPLGRGWDLQGAPGRDLLVVAWEAGLKLVRPVLEQAITQSRTGQGFSRIRVWAGGHTWAAIPYKREWNRWSGRAGVTVSASRTLTMAAAAHEVELDTASTLALLAGPPPMAVATAIALTHRGMPAADIQLATHSLLRCGNGRCGRCDITTPHGVVRACADGPVLRYDRLAPRSPDRPAG